MYSKNINKISIGKRILISWVAVAIIFFLVGFGIGVISAKGRQRGQAKIVLNRKEAYESVYLLDCERGLLHRQAGSPQAKDSAEQAIENRRAVCTSWERMPGVLSRVGID